jgi:hypothetical protein
MALLFGVVAWLSNCADNLLTTPTPSPSPSVSPSPSPSPSPTPTPAGFGPCDPIESIVTCAVDAPGERTIPVRAWGTGQIALCTGTPVNARLEPIQPSCPFVSRLTSWDLRLNTGLCSLQGQTNTPDVAVKCNASGDLRLCARVGFALGCGDFRVVQGGVTVKGLMGGEDVLDHRLDPSLDPRLELLSLNLF